MRIKDVKEKVSGFEYMLRQLDLQSGVGRDSLASLCWYGPGCETELLVELSRADKLKAFIDDGGPTVILDKLKLRFSQIWDIRGTFGLLEKEAVDDVQLFEVKRFALLVRESSAYLTDLVRHCAFHPAPDGFPDLSETISILDPRGENLPAFYIYDEYDAELAQKRKELQRYVSESEIRTDFAVAGGETVSGKAAGADVSDREIIRLQTECEELERKIREAIAIKLRPHVPALRTALELVAYWDLLIAKAYLARDLGMTMPVLKSGFGRESSAVLRYRGLFHPMVKALLEEKKHRYQAVDICLQPGPCLLTGANMSGKTVLLKSLALSQCLLQFGFPVPAQEAELFLFDRVELLVQDDQSEERGLSSFGAEMQRLNEVFGLLKQGSRMLLLVDELARTTNPEEGKAIVSAVLESLEDFSCVSMVSTHYGPVPNPVRRLRVRGFREDWFGKTENPGTVPVSGLWQKPLPEPASGSDAGDGCCPSGKSGSAVPQFDLSRIQACMDYSVMEEDRNGTPPAEALRIASLLGFDREIIDRAQRYYADSKVHDTDFVKP